MRFIVAVHDVSDPDRFWASAADAVPQMPSGITLHATYPHEGGTRAVCLWEAESLDDVRGFVDGAVGDAGRNDYFEVDPRHAFALGLPAHAASEARDDTLHPERHAPAAAGAHVLGESGFA